jgi:hypothetical protein
VTHFRKHLKKDLLRKVFKALTIKKRKESSEFHNTSSNIILKNSTNSALTVFDRDLLS